MAHLTAQELLDLVLDEGSFESWDQPVDHSGLDPTYQQELVAAAARAGTDESVLTGRGLMHGRPVAVCAHCPVLCAWSRARQSLVTPV